MIICSASAVAGQVRESLNEPVQQSWHPEIARFIHPGPASEQVDEPQSLQPGLDCVLVVIGSQRKGYCQAQTGDGEHPVEGA